MLIRLFLSFIVSFSQGFFMFSDNFVTSANFLGYGMKDIKNMINNQNFLIKDQNEGEPVTTCMDVHKEKIQSDGSLDKLKLRIVVRGD